MSGAGGTGTGEAADRLAAEARASAEALLDWLGPRLDDARARPGRPGAPRVGADRPPQSAGPCAWCPVCALVAALRGEQPELTARLAEQAAGLVVLVRLLLEGHGAHHPPTPSSPSREPAPHRGDDRRPPRDADHGPVRGASGGAGETGVVPGPVTPDPPHAGERPTGRRSPRPSPRLRAVPRDDGPEDAVAAPSPSSDASPGGHRGAPGRRPPVQRIPVRRVPREPC